MASRPDLDLSHALGHDSIDKRIEILRRIGDSGSISAAARQAGVSYKAAWQAIDTLSNLAGAALVERAVGGHGGGGASLSAAGRELLHAAEQLDRARREVLGRVARGRRGAALAPGPAALGLRTSMRNQLPCRVLGARARGGAVTVTLTTVDGARIRSRVTRESAQLLDLRPGREVLALFKATAVVVLAAGGETGDGNLLEGVVVRRSRGRGGGEVALQTAGGNSLVGFAEGDAGLRVGAQAAARFDESAVVIALPG
jgi:molybdate transport system regulatory protein